MASRPPTSRSKRPRIRTPKEIAARCWRRRGRPPPDVRDSIAYGMWLGHALPRFRRLTDHPLFLSIHGRLVAGSGPFRVAYWIQEHVEPDDVLGSATLKVDSLARILLRYVKVLPTTTFLPASLVESLIHGAVIQVDVLQELGALIVYQEQRVTQLGKLEQQMNVPMPAVTHEIKALADLYGQMLDAQIALGYGPRINERRRNAT